MLRLVAYVALHDRIPKEKKFFQFIETNISLLRLLSETNFFFLVILKIFLNFKTIFGKKTTTPLTSILE